MLRFIQGLQTKSTRLCFVDAHCVSAQRPKDRELNSFYSRSAAVAVLKYTLGYLLNTAMSHVTCSSPNLGKHALKEGIVNETTVMRRSLKARDTGVHCALGLSKCHSIALLHSISPVTRFCASKAFSIVGPLLKPVFSRTLWLGRFSGSVPAESTSF